MSEREERRLLMVLISVRELAEMGLNLVPEAQASAIQAIYNRAALAVSPQSDDEILRLWSEGEYSEGWATLALGVEDRLDAREMLQAYHERQCAEQGHEYQELAPYRVRCVRCGKIKEWLEEAL